MRRVRLSVPLALFCGLLVFGGCRSGSALHGRYSNFRAFYNTYYNAERKLEEGEESLDRADQLIDRTRLVELFPAASSQSGGASGPFQLAIDKSAELLRDRPDSKWADDALLVIGKAYFYQNNVVGAEQKFRETAAAAEARGEPRLAAEARFWLGRTLAAAERYDEGVEVLQDATARPDADRRWRARLTLALGELYARAGRWDVAAEALRAGAPDVDDRDLSARGFLLLGQVEENAERWDAAAEAYGRADERAGSYEIRYAARLSRALVLGLDAGRQDDAIDAVRRMRRDDKNYQRRSEVELVYARLLAAADRPADAQDRFRAVLYDPDLQGNSVRGQAHYRYGEFFRDVRDDYVRAAAHFDSAATSLRSQTLRPGERPTRAALLDAPATAQTYTGISSTLRRIQDVDSLLALGALSDEAFAARIEEIEAERTRVFQDDQRRADRMRDDQAFGGGGFVPSTGDRSDTRGVGVSDSGAPLAAGNEVGFLSFRDPTSVQAGRISFVQVWGDRPLLPNWRRRAAIEASAIASTTGGGGGDLSLSRGTGSGLRPLDLSPVPRTPAKREELTTELAGLRYELGNAYFLSIGLPDRAETLYRQILDESPQSTAAVRARYALAEIEAAAGRAAEADVLYREVADNTDVPELALAARLRLGEAIPEPEIVSTSAGYDAIRARWTDGDPLGAAVAFVERADADPEAPNAPRMYLAAASAYIDWAVADSVGWQAALPQGLRSRVLFPDAVGAAPDSTSADAVGVAPDSTSADATPANSGAETPDESSPERALESERAVEEVPAGTPAPDGEELDREKDEVETVSATPASNSRDRANAPRGVPPSVNDLVRGGAPVPAPARPEPDTLAAATPLPAAPAAAAPDLDSLSPGALDARADITPDAENAEAPRLADYLAAVSARYPGTAAAQKATALAGGLPSAETPDEPDEAPIDEPAAPVDAFAGEPLYGYQGSRPIDLALGGFTWQTQQVPNRATADAIAGAYRQAGYRSAVFAQSDLFVVVVGQYETESGATNRMEEFPDGIEIEDVEVVPLDSLALPDAASPDAAEPDDGASQNDMKREGDPDLADPNTADPDASGLDEDAPAAPAAVYGLSGNAPVDPAVGGFTWRLRSYGSPVELYGRSEVLRREGVRGGTLTVGGAVWLVVGQFETREAAQAVRDELPDIDAEEAPEIVPVGSTSSPAPGSTSDTVPGTREAEDGEAEGGKADRDEAGDDGL